MKRDGYTNKYTNPRKAETTTEDYLVELQTIKKNKSKDTKPKRFTKQIPKTTTLGRKKATTAKVTCEYCGLYFKARCMKIHIAAKHKPQTMATK